MVLVQPLFSNNLLVSLAIQDPAFFHMKIYKELVMHQSPKNLKNQGMIFPYIRIQVQKLL